MHRIRAGVTGLGLVFLVTLLGSIALDPPGPKPVRDEPGEPLAELGVAPSPGDRSDPGAGPAPAVPPTVADPEAERPIAGRRGASDRADQVVI